MWNDRLLILEMSNNTLTHYISHYLSEFIQFAGPFDRNIPYFAKENQRKTLLQFWWLYVSIASKTIQPYVPDWGSTCLIPSSFNNKNNNHNISFQPGGVIAKGIIFNRFARLIKTYRSNEFFPCAHVQRSPPSNSPTYKQTHISRWKDWRLRFVIAIAAPLSCDGPSASSRTPALPGREWLDKVNLCQELLDGKLPRVMDEVTQVGVVVVVVVQLTIA